VLSKEDLTGDWIFKKTEKRTKVKRATDLSVVMTKRLYLLIKRPILMLRVWVWWVVN
jgi:hypothetical protein